MIDTSIIENLAHDPSFAPAVADLLDELVGLPPEDARDSLRAAQDAIWSGAWRLPERQQHQLIDAIGRACA